MDIKANREKLELTQETLAERVGVSVRTVQDWEQGRYEPGRIRRIKLEEAFEWDIQ